MAPVSTDKLPEISDKLIRHIAKGEEAETIEMLDPHVREDLPWSVIVDVWTSILTDFGELQEITDQTGFDVAARYVDALEATLR